MIPLKDKRSIVKHYQWMRPHGLVLHLAFALDRANTLDITINFGYSIKASPLNSTQALSKTVKTRG